MKGSGLIRAAALALGLFVPALAHSTHHSNAITWWNTGTGFVGPNDFSDKCTFCHAATPPAAQLSGAGRPAASGGVGGSVLQHVFGQMGCEYASSLNATQREEIAAWFLARVEGTEHGTTSLLFTAANTTTNMNVGRTINAGTHMNVGMYAFDRIETLTINNGASLTWSGNTGTFTPATGFVGDVTFTYRGRDNRPNPDVVGHTYTGVIRVGTAPVLSTSPTTHGGTYNSPIATYQLVWSPLAPGTTFSISAGSLPPGLSLNPTTGAVTGTPTDGGTYNVTFRGNNNLGNGAGHAVQFNIARLTPTVTFGAQPPQTYAFNGSFNLTAASITPQLAVDDGIVARYASTTPGVCTVPVVTNPVVNIVSAGDCDITATSAATSKWNAASGGTQRIVIGKANQVVSFPGGQGPVPWANGGTFTINPLATRSSAGQGDGGISIAYGSGDTSVCTVSLTTVTTKKAGLCPVIATANGNTNYNAGQGTQNITISAVQPSAPAILPATPADQQVSVNFTLLDDTNNGGAPINHYTATCGGSSNTGTGSPIVVAGLTNGQSYTCSVTATQVAPYGLTSPSSATVNVTPAVLPAITSANNATFTVLDPATFDIIATGSPPPTISLSGTLPTGITFNGPGGSPRTLSGTPASGTAGIYPLVITADGSDPDATQNFTLTIARRNQTVDFTDPPDTTFGSGDVPLTASASSGLPITFTSQTPLICGIDAGGTSATLLDVGDCTIRAEQVAFPAVPGSDWNTAFQEQTFTIGKGNQTITFPAQTIASRIIAPGQTFIVNPPATTDAVGLTIEYTTFDGAICSSVGASATIMMHNVGVCRIIATQPGDSKWNPASTVFQDVALTVSSQSITFPAQAPQTYSPGGTFAVTGVVASSTLPISYFTNSPSVCTVADPLVATVTIVTGGTCAIRAEQGGNNNFTAAPPVVGTIQINPVVPDAPTIGTATPGNQHAKVEFTPPSENGGSPITSYRATCGGITGTGTTSPITVTGLTNGASYNCTVAAQNVAGFSAESASVGVTPALQGASLWSGNCQSCHGPTPEGARFNAAGASTSTAVLDYVIANNPQMNSLPQLTALNSLERQDLKQYITSFLMASYSATDATTPTPHTPNVTPPDKVINLGAHLSLNTVFPDLLGGPSVPGSFTQVAIMVPPANGTLTPLGGVEFLYTPNPVFTGVDTFQYRGEGNATGDTFTFSITVSAAAPVLSVVKSGTGTGIVFTDTPSSGIDCGSDCIEAYEPGAMVTLFAVADPGTTFIGWTGACTGASLICNVEMISSLGVTAIFDLTPIDLTVTLAGAGSGSVSSSPAGIACGATCVAGFPPNTPVTLTPTPTPGSAFTGWSGACTGTGACIVTMDMARSVTATFQPTFALNVAKSGLGSGTVTSSPSGINCGGTCSVEFVTGTVVTLTPTPAAGSAFTGWSGACTGTGACVVSMTVARSVTAEFTPTFTLTVQKTGSGNGTVTSSPAGISACGATCTADYLDGTIVDLTANIGPDTDFLGWGGACSGTGACQVTMSAARSVTANFKSSIALTVTHAGTGSGVVTSSPDGIGIACGAGCTVGFDPGTVVTLGRSPSAGSVFAGWGGACTGSGACVVTMSQSRTVTATFTLAAGPQADISIVSHTSNPPSAASVGQQVTFSLLVANNGPAAATGVVLTDNIPTNSAFVSTSAGCAHISGVVTCNLGSIASGASVQVDIVVQANAAGGATNFASVLSNETDPLTFNNASALAIDVTAANNVRLGNISTRMQVQGGDGALIGGFVIGGSANKTVAIVATGPSLAAFGISNPLANPSLTIVRSSDQAVIATNDDWQGGANAAQLLAAGFAPSDALEAGVLLNLPPGAYTALVAGGSGVSVLGVYEVDQPQVPLINISTRGNVLTGNDVMIGGFVISGNAPQTVAIQGIGPSLTAFGITTPLANPTITLIRASDQAILATNDDWQADSNAGALQAAGFAPGNALESGLLVTLPPGAYTVILSGANNTTGIGIIGIYTVD